MYTFFVFLIWGSFPAYCNLLHLNFLILQHEIIEL